VLGQIDENEEGEEEGEEEEEVAEKNETALGQSGRKNKGKHSRR
jgi:hypothetical protein